MALTGYTHNTVGLYSWFMLNRRQFLALTSLLLSGASPAAPVRHIRFGLTPVILDDRLTFLRDWQHWLEADLGQPVRFFQRGNYREITNLLLNGRLEMAWVCGYPYVREQQSLQLLAIPQYRGKTTYQSYIITGINNAAVTRLEDLRDRVFAFSDPDSNSGYLYPVYRLHKMDTKPEHFFSRSFFTWGHRNTIMAVAAGLAEGGAVDSYVWEQTALRNPELLSQTRLIEKSPLFGFPPIVARNNIPPEDSHRLQQLLLNMSADPTGKALLNNLGLDSFVKGDSQHYASISEMARAIAG